MPLVRFEHTLKDIIKILFFKKSCPCCGIKMKRHAHKEEYIEVVDDEYNYGDSYRIKFYYYCNTCNKRVEVCNLMCTKKRGNNC